MKFCWCTIFVTNMESSVAFYTQVLNLEVEKRFPSKDQGEICFLTDGNGQIELILDPESIPARNPEGIALAFEVTSLEETLLLMEKHGIKIDEGPLQPNPQVTFFYVRDPDGVRLLFIQHS